MNEKPIILVVDDTESMRVTMASLLNPEKYEIAFACNGFDALEQAAQLQPDLILLDVMMPGMDGFEVCRRLRDDPLLAEVPIIFVTALDDREAKLEGLNAGGDDFITKPIDRAELRARVRTILKINRYRQMLTERTRFEKLVELSPDGIVTTSPDGSIEMVNKEALRILPVVQDENLLAKNLWSFFPESQREEAAGRYRDLFNGCCPEIRFEASIQKFDGSDIPVDIHANIIEWGGQTYIQTILHDISDQKLAEYQLKMAYTALEDTLEDTIIGWARALELRDQETEGHSRRVTELTMRIAARYPFDEKTLKHIRRGAILHDIGKIGVPDSILLKPGKLTDEEWVIMRKHPQFSYKILSPILFLVPALTIPLYHHEKWDGCGYPQKLQGEEIPLEARIFAVVDVYDALTSERPYHGPWPKEKALEYIQEQSGSHFDPDVVNTFLEIMRADTPSA